MSKQCVKCGYVRQASDTAPDYECPKCGVIYSKVPAPVVEMECASCGYVRMPTDTAPNYRCPRCNANYSTAAFPAKRATKVELKKCPYCAEDVKAAATLCPHCNQPIFTTNPKSNAVVHIILSAVLFVIIYAAISAWTEREGERLYQKAVEQSKHRY